MLPSSRGEDAETCPSTVASTLAAVASTVRMDCISYEFCPTATARAPKSRGMPPSESAACRSVVTRKLAAPHCSWRRPNSPGIAGGEGLVNGATLHVLRPALTHTWLLRATTICAVDTETPDRS